MIVGEIARALGFPVPELVLIELDPAIGRAEPDPEIQDLLLGSAGLNLGLDFLPGALPFNPAAEPTPSPELAADIVWLDALATNVDRTPAKPEPAPVARPALADRPRRGALLPSRGTSRREHARGRFEAVRDHVLLPYASSIADADERLAGRVERHAVERIVAEVPAEWLGAGGGDVYVDYLSRRLETPRGFVEEAESARG